MNGDEDEDLNGDHEIHACIYFKKVLICILIT